MARRARMERLEQAKAKLNALPDAMRKGIADALDKGADEIVAAQKRLAPVSSGRLRESIRKTRGGGRGAAEGLADDYVIRVVAGGRMAPHAHLVEFGTKAPRTVQNWFGRTGVKVTVGPMPAQPFFFPAYRAYKKRVKGRASRAVRKAAREAVRG